MATHTSDDNGGLRTFLNKGKTILAKTGGVNERSRSALVRLAELTQLTREELEAASGRLGLSENDVDTISSQAGLESEEGGGGGGLKIAIAVLALVLVLGSAGVGGYILFTREAGVTPSTTSVADKGTTAATDKGAGIQVANNVGSEPQPTGPASPLMEDAGFRDALKALMDSQPGSRKELEGLKYADANQRAKAWRYLMASLHKFVDPHSDQDPVKQLLIIGYAREPQDSNADLIRAGLMRNLPPDAPRVPTEAEGYTYAYWALQTALAALDQNEAPEQRIAEVIRAAEHSFSNKLNRQQKLSAVRKDAGEYLSHRYYNALIKLAEKEPKKAMGYFDRLTPIAKLYLSDGDLRERTADFLDTIKNARNAKVVVKADPPTTPETMPPKNVGTKPPETGKTSTEVVKKPDDPPMKPAVEEPKTMSPADARLAKLLEVAEAQLSKPRSELKENIDVLRATVTMSYYSALASALARKDAVGQAKYDDLGMRPPELMEEAPAMMPMGNAPNPFGNQPQQPPAGQPQQPGAGFAGAQPGQTGGGFAGQQPPLRGGFAGQQPQQPPQGGFAGQQQMGGGFAGQQPPPQGFAGQQPPPQGFAGQQQMGGGFAGQQPPPQQPMGGFLGAQQGQPMGGFLGQPGGGENPMPMQQAMPALTAKEMAALAARMVEFPKNTPEGKLEALLYLSKNIPAGEMLTNHAESAAKYLLSIKELNEFNVALQMLPELSRHRAILLAVADMLEHYPPPAANGEQIVMYLLQKKIDIKGHKDWQKRARHLLLQQAMNAKASAAASSAGDTAQQLLCAMYAEQAAMLNVVVPGEATSATKVLERLIEVVGGKANAAKYDGPGKKEVAQLRNELEAVRYAAKDDLQKMIGLQRLWLHVLAAHIAQQHGNQAVAAAQVLRSADREAGRQASALHQLHAMEEHILRLWVLAASESAAAKQ